MKEYHRIFKIFNTISYSILIKVYVKLLLLDDKKFDLSFKSKFNLSLFTLYRFLMKSYIDVQSI